MKKTIPCKCGHIKKIHELAWSSAKDLNTNLLIYRRINGIYCASCNCIKFDRDNLQYLEIMYGKENNS